MKRQIERLKFLPGNQTNFLVNIVKKGGLPSDLARLVNISPRTFSDWKTEKSSIPLMAARIYCKKFNLLLPESENTLISRWRLAKYEAAVKGGQALFRKHGSPGTPLGRSKGGKVAIRILQKKGLIKGPKEFKLPESYSSELAEWVGIMLGDGGLTDGQLHITLNSKADQGYIPYVSNLGKTLFGEEPRRILRKTENVVILYTAV